MLIDTHCHLDFSDFDSDRDAVISGAQEEGINYIINIGSSLKGSQDSVALAKKYDCVYATVGLHPHEADQFPADVEEVIEALARNNKVVAIGEVGLDYYKNYSKPENQMPLFKVLVNVAKRLDLPLVIHSRQAQVDTLKVLKEAMPIRAVVHCFSGDDNFLKNCLDLGFFVSYTCNITYKKAGDLRELVTSTPLERMMLETDAPFLPPEGMRGKRNDPSYVKLLAQEVAKLKGLTFEKIAEVTTSNAIKFFNLK
ncbi:MAG: TatD family hydrolase [Candidatus Omnitrophota bacterium]